MIRLFKVHYPLRTLILLAGEAVIVSLSFLLATMWRNPDSWLLGNVEGGYLQVLAVLGPKILVVTGLVLSLSHLFDLYDSSSQSGKGEHAFRLLLVLAFVALALAALGSRYPSLLPGNGSAFWGLVILTVTLFGWRAAYSWMVKQPFLRERVYVLGTGERAERLVRGLRERSALGVEVVGWTGELGSELIPDLVASRHGTGERAERSARSLLDRSEAGKEGVGWAGNVQTELTRDAVASHLISMVRGRDVHRVIVAMPDRRGTLPVDELLDLRLGGVKVEEATSWLERISGSIEVEQLYPSWLIFAEGFRFSRFFRMMRRGVNFSVALAGLVLSLPLFPFIWLAVKLDSPGPVLYRQQRVGRRGVIF